MREKILFDNEWLFHKGDIIIDKPTNKGAMYIGAKTERYKFGPAARYYYAEVDSYELDKEYKPEKWINVNLPHDYLMDSPIDPNENNTLGFIKRENGWYIKKFYLNDDDKNKRITILFEGIAVKSTIFINGCLIKHNFSAYNSFEVDITDYVVFDEENRLVVYCDTQESEGWWYQGGGIYRHVYMIKTDLISTDLWGIYVKPELIENNKWKVDVTTSIRNDYYLDKDIDLEIEIYNKNELITKSIINSVITKREIKDIHQLIMIDNPKLWSPEEPNLYTAVANIYVNKELVDSYDTRFGFRTFYVDAEKGLFINDKKYTIKGVCGHNNGGRLFGQAVPDNIMRYRIEELKKIGVNGYRTTHYMQSEYLMDVLDEEGFIVMDETRWFESSDESKEQLKALIKRDRNRPSVFFYSLGNEEPFTTLDQGKRIFKNLKEFVKKMDDTRLITTPISFDPNDSTIFEDCDVIGINYNFESVDTVREKCKEKGMLFTEFCACGITRGWCYEDDDNKGYKSVYDKDTENIFFRAREFNYKFLHEREYMLGGYAWHAYEYNGETIWPRLSSCSGLLDLYLQKKESYYHTKSFLSDEPMVYILPHWNFKGQEGREIRVVVYTNCDRVELYLNDELIGKKEVEVCGHAEWNVPFKEGRLVAKGYNKNELVALDKRITTKDPYQLKLELETKDVQANGKDYALFTCSVVDIDGNEIPNAEGMINFICNGVGSIYSTGSDTSDHTSPLLSYRKMRAGKVTVAVKMKNQKGDLVLIAESPNLKSTFFKKTF